MWILGRSLGGGSESKESTCNVGDLGSIPGLGRSPGEGNGYPLQYFCLENSTDRGGWRAIVHKVNLILEVESTYILFYQPVYLAMSQHHTVFCFFAATAFNLNYLIVTLHPLIFRFTEHHTVLITEALEYASMSNR